MAFLFLKHKSLLLLSVNAFGSCSAIVCIIHVLLYKQKNRYGIDTPLQQRVYMYAYTYFCIYVYAYTSTPAPIQTHICMSIHTCVNAHKTILLLQRSKVMQQTHISLFYFVIRFFEVFHRVIFIFFLSGNSSQYFPQYELQPVHVYLTLTDCSVCLHSKMCLQLH